MSYPTHNGISLEINLTKSNLKDKLLITTQYLNILASIVIDKIKL